MSRWRRRAFRTAGTLSTAMSVSSQEGGGKEGCGDKTGSEICRIILKERTVSVRWESKRRESVVGKEAI